MRKAGAESMRDEIIERDRLSQAISSAIYDRCYRWSDEKLKNLKANNSQGYAARAELTDFILSAVEHKARKRPKARSKRVRA